MKGPYYESRKRKAVVGVALFAYALAPLFCKLDGVAALACNLLDQSAWAALSALRPAILLIGGQAVSAHLYETSRLLQGLLGILASLWPLLCVLARQAQ
jgi:hypothetical protein